MHLTLPTTADQTRDAVFLVFLAVVFVVQLASAVDVMRQPGDSGSVDTIAILVVACFLIGIARAWELVGGPSIGIAHEVAALIRGEENTWPITVAVTDTSGATATAELPLSVADAAAASAAGNLRYAESAWHHPHDGGGQPH